VSCSGLVSVSGLNVVLTGWVHVEGLHVARSALAQRLAHRGAHVETEFSGVTDVLVLGDYLPHQVQDDRAGGTDALDQIYRSRRARGINRRHVHLVLQDDLGDLLDGRRVPCRRTPVRWAEREVTARRATVRVRPY
jgi:hypothetical protein